MMNVVGVVPEVGVGVPMMRHVDDIEQRYRVVI